MEERRLAGVGVLAGVEVAGAPAVEACLGVGPLQEKKEGK